MRGKTTTTFDIIMVKKWVWHFSLSYALVKLALGSFHLVWIFDLILGSLLENPTKKTSDSSTSSLRLKTDDPSNEVAYGLQRVYKKVLQPLEEKTNFNQFLATK